MTESGPEQDGSGATGTAEAGAASALEMEGVRKVYEVADEEVVALDHAELTVASDEIIALVGPSGSGKTTLCSIAGGILSPTEGKVVVGGSDISDYSPKQLTEFRRDSVGFDERLENPQLAVTPVVVGRGASERILQGAGLKGGFHVRRGKGGDVLFQKRGTGGGVRHGGGGP